MLETMEQARGTVGRALEINLVPSLLGEQYREILSADNSNGFALYLFNAAARELTRG